MRINRNNYESFLVDYFEGVLSAKMKQEVENFLLLNPDIKEEFEIYSGELIEISEVSFPEKENLKKIPFEQTSVSSDYFQQLCIGHIEGLLPEYDEKFLSSLIKNDKQKQKELTAFEKTKLIIEKETFNEKILLKQAHITHKVTHDNFEEYCIACMEGWLDQAGLIELNSYLAQNRTQKRVLDIYYKTRLIPDLTIVYPYKSKIKRFSILSPTIKKYISIASSVAAILVLSFMVYYTYTIDDKTQLSGNVSALRIEKNNVEPTKNLISKQEVVDTNIEEQNESILADPFGYKKINGKINEKSANESRKNAISIDPMQPKQIGKIECQPCDQNLNNKLLATANIIAFEAKNIPKEEVNIATPESNVTETPAWAIAQAGISGFNKITNSELKVEKNQDGDKTKIAFNSKYFSFSTQVNKKN